MATILIINANRAFDLNGFATPGALATFYDSGTTTERTVYTDPGCTVPHTSPVVADGAGVFPPIYDTGDGAVGVLVTDKHGVALAGYPLDPIVAVGTSQTGAAGISFDPIPEIPEKNVQAAIERLQRNLVEPLADFGLGVTGNAAVLANIDATNTASGFYRFDGTTTGTFPTGVTAADGGSVLVFRSTANNAFMFLLPSGSNRVNRRRLATTWQAWGWLADSGDTASAAIWGAGTATTGYLISPKDLRTEIDNEKRTWQGFTGSRTHGVSYRNTTGRTIEISIAGDASGSPATAQVSANNVGWINVGRFGEAGELESSVYFSVPPGSYYRVNGAVAFNWWSEFR